MPKRNIYTIATVVALIMLAFSKPTQADSLEDCNSSNATRILSGCSVIITQGNLEDTVLAIAYSRRSDVYVEQGLIDKTIADRKKTTELAPKDKEYKNRLADAYVLRGDISLKSRNFDGAIADFTEAIKLNPSGVSTLIKRSDVYLAKDELDEAIRDLTAANRLLPDAKPLRERLAKLNELSGVRSLAASKFKRAIADFTEAIKLAKAIPSLYMSRASAYEQSNNVSRAIEDYSKAIGLKPDLLKAYRRRGELLLKQGTRKKAIADFDEFLKRKPRNVDVLLLRAIAYEPETSNSKALHDYKMVLKIDPNNNDAMEGIQRILGAGTAIVKLVQIELKRIGCDPGIIDGQWGRKGKSALSAYAEHAGVPYLAKWEPNETLLALIKMRKEHVCPATKNYGSDRKIHSKIIRKKQLPKLNKKVSCCITWHRKYCRKFSVPSLCNNIRRNCRVNVNKWPNYCGVKIP